MIEYPENSYLHECQCGTSFVAPKGSLACHKCLYERIASLEKERDELAAWCSDCVVSFCQTVYETGQLSFGDSNWLCAFAADNYDTEFDSVKVREILAKRDREQQAVGVEKFVLKCGSVGSTSGMYLTGYCAAINKASDFANQLRKQGEE